MSDQDDRKRRIAVNELLLGRDPEEVARAAGVGATTLLQWLCEHLSRFYPQIKQGIEYDIESEMSRDVPLEEPEAPDTGREEWDAIAAVTERGYANLAKTRAGGKKGPRKRRANNEQRYWPLIEPKFRRNPKVLDDKTLPAEIEREAWNDNPDPRDINWIQEYIRILSLYRDLILPELRSGATFDSAQIAARVKEHDGHVPKKLAQSVEWVRDYVEKFPR